MTEFRTRKNGKAYPLRNNRVVQKATQISQAQLKHIHIHGLAIAGYAVDLADNLRKKALVKAVNKHENGHNYICDFSHLLLLKFALSYVGYI